MKTSRCFVVLVMLGLIVDLRIEAASRGAGPLNPIRNTTTRSGYTIDTVGDTLHQAAPENTRLIIRVSGADKKMIKPGTIALIDKSGAAIKPVFREDRKVGHEENTGLPITVDGSGGTSGVSGAGVGVDLNKIFGPHGDYAYTKV